MATIASAAPSERQWYIVGRWQQYEGESRANLLRIAAIGAFYCVQLAHYYLFSSRGPEQTQFHQQATAIAVAWTLLALAILLCLRRQIFPAILKYASTGSDLLLLTALASLAAGPHSPLIAAYFVVIALAALRFSLGLIWFATLGSMLGYWLLVGIEDAKTSRWFDDQHAVAPVEQLLTLLSLGITGIVLGQIVRRAKGLADEYSRRLAAAGKTAGGASA